MLAPFKEASKRRIITTTEDAVIIVIGRSKVMVTMSIYLTFVSMACLAQVMLDYRS
jgi:hypothetical protein